MSEALPSPFTKDERFARKTDEGILNPDFCKVNPAALRVYRVHSGRLEPESFKF